MARFAIDDWAALAPGLATREDWLGWARTPWLPQGALDARLDAMPAIQRRRLSQLGRAAAQVAWACHAPADDIPVVFASGYGDAQRALQLLESDSLRGEMSPTEFALSVHNAIGAMYSIARRDGAAYSSIAAGAGSAAAGMVEAAGWLSEGAASVLLVCYEAPLPPDYAAFTRGPAAPYAWAWRVSAARPGEPHFELTCTAQCEVQRTLASSLPAGLEVLRFALSGDRSASVAAEGSCSHWTRHA